MRALIVASIQPRPRRRCSSFTRERSHRIGRHR
jgi:hypothetical protein